ncbi:hypothetical protein C461_10783 [Halorubrum aidingense JCM 13560]|uniref:Uncharacterized protein n=1 Tax=Halorubrum aidingense JCM 13560 TaxID=1230454 RepID=M0PCI3_9EURY|nr:hypothetical protein [Halorubrum aidingense]EMA66520.1 hypothetical protein C461_10783 [Halorubrum aidingense JCM 13560]
MSSRDDRRDDDLEARLDDLEDVLTELRRDLRETERDRRGPPRPPRLSELVRFTEQYTIPTIIALLETTIKSLELLQGTLRLADPGRSLADGAAPATDRLGDVRDGASAGLARSLGELRTALSEADLPEEAASRSIIADARDLTAEIEARIEESRREADSARRGERRDPSERTDSRGDDSRGDDGDGRGDSGGIRIDVTDPNDTGDDPPGTAVERDAADPGDDSPAPEVDVESELESIKRQIDGDGDDEDTDGVVDSDGDDEDSDVESGDDADGDSESDGVSSNDDAESDDADGGERAT